MANAPYVTEKWNWRKQSETYVQQVLFLLRKRGIQPLREQEVLIHYTPEQLQQDTFAHCGAIYGISSNTKRQTFFRPSNKNPNIKGLWYVGGTTHPGGGTPIVTLSGQLVAEYICTSIH